MLKIFLRVVVMSILSAATCHASSSVMVVRTKGNADKSIELSHISEVVFDDEMVCVKITSGADFTMADSQFISLRFDHNGTGLPDQSSISENALDIDDTEMIYDINGHFVGNSADNLTAGIYMVVKQGCVKKIVR